MNVQLIGRPDSRPSAKVVLLGAFAALSLLLLVVPAATSALRVPQESLLPGALLVRENFDVRSVSLTGRRGPVLFDISRGASSDVRIRPGSAAATSSQPAFLIDDSETCCLTIELAWPQAPSVDLTPKHPSYGPAWTPDGRGFVYTRVLGRDVEFEFDTYPHVLVLRRRIRDPASERTLTARRPRTQDSEPTWAPDGRRLAFTRSRGLVDGQIYVLDLATGRETRITPGEDADWSPTQNRLAYVCESTDLCVIDLSSGRRRQLTRGGNDGQPLWSPDGRSISFERITDSLDKQVRLIPASGGRSRVVVADGDLLDWPRQRKP